MVLFAVMGISTLLLLIWFTGFSLSTELQSVSCGENLSQKAVVLEEKASQLYLDWHQTKDAEKYKSAILLFKEALKLEPRLITPYVNISTHYSVSNPEKALKLLKKGLAQCPDEPALYNSLGLAYASLRQYRDAVQSYEKALKLGWQGPLPSLYFNIGNNYAKFQDYGNAIPYLKKAIELDPSKYNAYYSLAIVYYYKGEKQKARETFKKLQALDPEGSFGQKARNALKQLNSEQ